MSDGERNPVIITIVSAGPHNLNGSPCRDDYRFNLFWRVALPFRLGKLVLGREFG